MRRPKSVAKSTPQDELTTILMVCKVRGVDRYTRDAVVLAAFAESDFGSDATQDGLEGGRSVGVFQQKPQYWPSATKGTAAQCNAFIDNFRRVTGDIVEDCWHVQRWYPSERFDPESVETLNYTERVARAARIAQTGRVDTK